MNEVSAASPRPPLHCCCEGQHCCTAQIRPSPLPPSLFPGITEHTFFGIAHNRPKKSPASSSSPLPLPSPPTPPTPPTPALVLACWLSVAVLQCCTHTVDYNCCIIYHHHRLQQTAPLYVVYICCHSAATTTPRGRRHTAAAVAAYTHSQHQHQHTPSFGTDLARRGVFLSLFFFHSPARHERSVITNQHKSVCVLSHHQ